MAIHWQYIKGLHSGGAKYTFLEFQETTSPKVYVGTNSASASGTGNTDLGYLATTFRENTFTQKNVFTYIGGSPYSLEVSGYSMFYRGLEIALNGDTAHKGAYTIKQVGNEYFHNFWVNSGWHNFEINDTSYFRVGTGSSYFWTNLIVGQTNENKNLTVYGNASISGTCSANYFDATSDIRAKTNIKPLHFNALDFIDNLNLYSFNYKNDNSPSIGIIAQEVQDVQIDEFKLVSNEKATGQDEDFMSIKESKLTYILLKAVKELQAEIKELKTRLGE